MPWYATELEWIKEIQHLLRSPPMDWFFLGWNLVDTLGFVLAIVTFVWYLIDRKIGIKLFYIMILSGVINKLLKTYFGLPRPCQLDPSVGLLCFKSPGLPSGAAQSAILYAGIIFIEAKKRIYHLVGILIAIFLCFSRIYLGVHFFTDLLGGILVGIGLVIIYWKLFPKLERYWKELIFLFPILLLLVSPRTPFWLAALSVGMGIWLTDLKKIKEKGRWTIRVKQTISVILGLCMCMIGMTLFPHLVSCFVLVAGFWLSFLGAEVINWNLKKQKEVE